jgi:diguanylate cyclase (GGDEF)-like protein
MFEGLLRRTYATRAIPDPRSWQPSSEVCRLGDLLYERRSEVVARMVARSTESGVLLDDVVEQRFLQAGEASTAAVAGWMSGESCQAAAAVGQEVWQLFGALAAQRAAPLNEVSRRCWRWGDAVGDLLRTGASELRLSPRALSQALNMLELILRITIVQVCKCFDAEREHADEELARRQEALAFMATHDALTGLPNRTLIVDRLEQMLLRARRSEAPAAAFVIDLDNFKAVNDTVGHRLGDELLRAVAARLDGVVRDVDALGRLGGDEFVVVAGDMSLSAGPEPIAERLLDTLRAPVKLGEDRIPMPISAAIGIAAGDRASASELLHDAGIAMYRAKLAGRNRYVVFEDGTAEPTRRRAELETQLRDALANDEFFLAFLPSFDLGDMTPTGLEALIRWNSPTRGVVQPGAFIPLLEETGLIVEVGAWVLRQACRQAARWRAQGHPVGVAVNVSARQLSSDAILADVQQALTTSGLETGALTLEITETTLMRNLDETALRLRAIKDLGVRIAIDDFGTGYSSLGHLRQLAVDALKIDRSFVSGAGCKLEGESLIHTLVQLGKALCIETIAEGIEQPGELSLLRGEHCDSGQGFLFARPLDAPSADVFLRDRARQAEHAPAPSSASA